MNQENINRFLYSLYNDVSPMSVSIECRKKHGIYDDSSFVYGDSHLPSLNEIFEQVSPKPGEVFYDLGSGGGRLVLYAALSFPFAKCVGIEFLDDLVTLAQNKLENLKNNLLHLDGFDQQKMGEIKFIQGDLAKTDISDADIVYACSTCFDEKLMNDLAVLLEEQLHPGTRVISFTNKLPSDKFKIISSQSFAMEWGQATAFFQEKI